MMEHPLGRKAARWLYNYFLFFLVVAFLVSCTTMLFVRVLANTLDLTLTNENVQTAAKLTFLNVILLSVLFALIDTVRRKATTERVTKKISDAAKEIVKGDFDVRIARISAFSADENYNVIIECFNTMAKELAGMETLRTDFIANVSHEMKTPLTVIQNYGKLLQAPALSEEKRVEYAEAIGDAAHRLADVMTNILKLNRLENQQIYPSLTRYDLSEQLCEVLLGYESLWERKGIEIESAIADGITVTADAELLSLVWSNLFSNAFKFTEEGGRVTITLEADEKYATVRIGDTGCGIPPDVGAHIFEKFYQGDTSHATEGNGLGLALVKRVMDILDGEIRVESKVGIGTTFTVRIERQGNGLEAHR